MSKDVIRRVRLAPYRKGCGPSFSLTLWDTARTDRRGCSYLGYELRQRDKGITTVLFTGEDFAGSPMHSDDSDETIASLLGFLTLRPGDTDREYFDAYTPEQLEYCSQHAETLSAEVCNRFGEV